MRYATQETTDRERSRKEHRRIMDDALLEQLSAGKYMLVTSYRKNGTPVATPVWGVRDGDTLGVQTQADSWKVRRIRARGDILVGPCDLRGNPTGDPVPATAEITDAATSARYRSLIARKYGIIGRLMILNSRLRRGGDTTLGIRVRLTP
jgi:PPOX class probable F420-dependent enzyme